MAIYVSHALILKEFLFLYVFIILTWISLSDEIFMLFIYLF